MKTIKLNKKTIDDAMAEIQKERLRLMAKEVFIKSEDISHNIETPGVKGTTIKPYRAIKDTYMEIYVDHIQHEVYAIEFHSPCVAKNSLVTEHMDKTPEEYDPCYLRVYVDLENVTIEGKIITKKKQDLPF